ALALFFSVLNLSGSALFLRGARRDYWGWVPDTGPLYAPFLVYFNAYFIAGLYQLRRALGGIESSFRRNRARLIQIGTVVTLSGGFVDFARFALARFWPDAERLYPLGIPANMLLALMLATSIVRYRLFNVNTAVKRTAVYAALCGLVTATLVLLTRTVERYV